MAMLRALKFNRPYEPKPRLLHYAGVVGGKCFIFAGKTVDFNESELSSCVEIFDQYVEQWRQLKTTGTPPMGLYFGGCCVSSDGDLYAYGGFNRGSIGSGGLYKLSSLTHWSLVSGESDEIDCPMRKSNCRLVCFGKKKVAVIGGYGQPPVSLQPGASFIKDKRSPNGYGWTNEIHVFECKYGLKCAINLILLSLT